MSNNPLVSVLMPCYNAGLYLREAIDSILNQTYRNIELILIDDGSKDDTRSIIDDYASRDGRIVVNHNPQNMGLIRTLNKGVGIATGSYIARMDADDVSVLNRIETLLDLMEKNPDVDVISAGYYHLSESGHVVRRIYPKACESIALKFVSFFCTPVNHPCMMAKAEIMKNNLFDEQYIHSEDYEIFSRLLLNGHKFMNSTDALYYLRKNSESVSFKYEQIQISTHTKISERNIFQYFGIKYEFFIHKIMINRISFNVTPNILKQAINNLIILKKEFILKEKPAADSIKQINDFLTEQKIDIFLQSLKYAYLFNKVRIFLLILMNLNVFLSGRGRQYMRSKLRIDKH